MTAFLSLFRNSPPLAAFVDARPARRAIERRGRTTVSEVRPAIGRRELAAAALVAGAQLLLMCGYALLIALVCSAMFRPAP